MTREEAIERIKDHMFVHKIYEKRAVKITEALEMAISALEQPGWIPCKEAYPTEPNYYLVTVKGLIDDGIDISIEYYSPYTDDTEWWKRMNVIAWKPLPKPYKEDADD